MALQGVGLGIETHPLSEYIMQTTFLKMTGASEQKLKCICWEVSSYDYEFRREYLKNGYGECSCGKDKNNVYKDVGKAIHRLDNTYNDKSLFKDCHDKDLFIEDVINTIEGIMECSLLSEWDMRDYVYFKSHWKDVIKKDQCARGELMKNDLKDYYEKIVYRHRNRCAHNLTSYQNNLPTLKKLAEEGYRYENYFFRFAILVLLDEIFMRQFEYYHQALNNEWF